MTTQTFEEAIQEFLERSREMLEEETTESLPPGLPSPYRQDGPPYECAIRLDERTIRNYVRTIGEDNPLYTNPAYAKSSKYGCLTIPGPFLSMVRGITAHGAQSGEAGRQRPGGYPVANFFSGTAWEFFDVLRIGSKFSSSMVTKELIEKPGSRGNLMFFISELFFWDDHGDLPAKCSGTLIMVPIETMGTSRTMPVERLGEKLLYDRNVSNYSQEDIQRLLEEVENVKRRGSDTLYWEDVEIGEKLGPMVIPPWTLQDYGAPRIVGEAVHGSSEGPGDEMAFEQKFRQFREKRGGAGGEQAVIHPATRWPWSPADEHEDALMAAYRAQPAPFDGGVQRVQIPNRLLSDWMGDEGFVRRQYTAIRKPVYYGDTTYYTGEVVKKFKEVQEGADEPGGAPGKREYYAVGINIEGRNQVGEVSTPGTATVYLPSREAGPVVLPIPHSAQPPFVNYQTYYKEWY